MSHKFQDSLKKGLSGQKRFLKAHKGLIIESEVRAYDFLTVFDDKVELKTDQYDLDKTEYFFFERWSDKEKRKPGGPWQSATHNVDYFVYFFTKNDVYFVFENKLLLAVLNCLVKHQKVIRIFNMGWITEGFLISREDLKPIYSKYKLNERNRLWLTDRLK